MFLLTKLPWNCKIIHSIKTSYDLSTFWPPFSFHALSLSLFLSPSFISSYLSFSTHHLVSSPLLLLPSFRALLLQQRNIKMRFDESVIRLPVFCPLSPFWRRLLVLKAKKCACVCVYPHALERVYKGGARGGGAPSYLFSDIPSSIQAYFEILLR